MVRGRASTITVEACLTFTLNILLVDGVLLRQELALCANPCLEFE